MSQKIFPSSAEEFHRLTRPMLGMNISEPWRGYGSALFLELGKLGGHISKKKNHRQGEATIMIEWSWRVERLRSISFGTWSGIKKMSNGIASLRGLKIDEISLVGRLPEIQVKLSENLWLQSFTTVEGSPEWRIKSIDGSWLYFKAGRLVRETGRSSGSHAV